MAKKSDDKKLDATLEKFNELDKRVDLIDYKVKETIKDVERLNGLFTTLNNNFIRLREQVDPMLKIGKWLITVVFGVVVTAILALVVKTS